jgi:hypothetical protein
MACRRSLDSAAAGSAIVLFQLKKHHDFFLEFIRLHAAELSAIGEVGLDFWLAKEEPAKETQRTVFRQFILLSIELGLPLNVHSRSTGRHAVAMLLENHAARVPDACLRWQSVGCHARRGGRVFFFRAAFDRSIPPETKTGQTVAALLSASGERQPCSRTRPNT